MDKEKRLTGAIRYRRLENNYTYILPQQEVNVNGFIKTEPLCPRF